MKQLLRTICSLVPAYALVCTVLCLDYARAHDAHAWDHLAPSSKTKDDREEVAIALFQRDVLERFLSDPGKRRLPARDLRNQMMHALDGLQRKASVIRDIDAGSLAVRFKEGGIDVFAEILLEKGRRKLVLFRVAVDKDRATIRRSDSPAWDLCARAFLDMREPSPEITEGRNDYLIQTLKAPGRDNPLSDREAAMVLIKRRDDYFAIGALLCAFRFGEPRVRLATAPALARWDSWEADQALLSAMTDPSAPVREAVASIAFSLRSFKFPSNAAGVKLLLPMLNDTDPRVRMQAAKSMIKLGDPRGFERLFRMEMGERLPHALIKEVALVLEELRSKNEYSHLLWPLLNNPDPLLRRQAVHHLGFSRNQSVAPALARIFDGPDETLPMRTAALAALAQLGGHEADQSMLKALADPEQDMRGIALSGIESFEKHASGELLKTLQRMAIGDPEQALRKHALRVAKKLSNEPDLVKFLYGVVEENRLQYSAGERIAAAEALATFGPKYKNRLVHPLTLNPDPDPDVRRIIATLITQKGLAGFRAIEGDIVRQLKNPDGSVREDTLDVLAHLAMGDADIHWSERDELVQLLGDPNELNRQLAINALSEYSNASFAELLIKLLEEGNSTQRVSALRLLPGSWEYPTVIAPLMAVLDEPNVVFYAMALRAVEYIAVKLVESLAAGTKLTRAWVEPLQAIADDGRLDWHAREEALWALGIMGYPEAVPKLLEFLGDDDARIREAARRAILDIGPNAMEYLMKEGGLVASLRRRLWPSASDRVIQQLIETLRGQARSLEEEVKVLQQLSEAL